LKIDGKECGAREGQTVLEVAQENGIYIPTLCHLDGLCDVGACRLCLVELKGSPKLQPACVTKVQEGMEVTVNSDRLAAYRKLTIEMLFSERNHICSVCVTNGHCDLQDLAVKLGVTHISVPYLHPRMPVDASHPRFVADHNRCVLCMRCVRVCSDIEGAKTWNVMGRGSEARVITDLAQPWGESETCTGCGKCVQVCPTGSLSEKGKSAGEMAKRRQFLPYLTMMREERS
ncbi:MAG TPA: bidirectional hydrogenase complex protein HoxU, partial [Terriglobales bacterium]